MPERRTARDHESVQRVLVLSGAIFGVVALGFLATGAWLLLTADGEGRVPAGVGWLVMGLLAAAFAAGCAVVGRDDGTGRWCETCVTRNPQDAETCAHCGALLG